MDDGENIERGRAWGTGFWLWKIERLHIGNHQRIYMKGKWEGRMLCWLKRIKEDVDYRKGLQVRKLSQTTA